MSGNRVDVDVLAADALQIKTDYTAIVNMLAWNLFEHTERRWGTVYLGTKRCLNTEPISR